ncbi:MAG: GAF domain-containing protein [Planctomycetota bacterium]
MPPKDEGASSKSLDPKLLAGWVARLGASPSTAQAVLRILREVLGMQRARIGRLAPSDQLHWVLECDEDAVAWSQIVESRPLDRDFEGIVLRRGRSLSMNNAATHRLWRNHPAQTEDGIAAFTGVPIHAFGRPWGTLSLYDLTAKELTARTAHALGRIAEAAGLLIERSSQKTPLEASLSGDLAIRDDFGQPIDGIDSRGPALVLGESGAQLELADVCFRVAWSEETQSEEVRTVPGDAVLVYRRGFGSVGLWTRRAESKTEVPRSPRPREGRLVLVQDADLSRDATQEMLEYLGWDVEVRDPGELGRNGGLPKDSIVVWGACDDRGRKGLEPELEAAGQRLLILTDDDRPSGLAGGRVLRRPFSLPELAESLQALDG